MIVIFADGMGRRARILQLSGPVMRVAIETFDDVAEFTFVNGNWVSDDNQPVQFLFSLETAGHAASRSAVAAIRAMAGCSAGGSCLLSRVAALPLSQSA